MDEDMTEFEQLMDEIYPTVIPSVFISQLKFTLKNGEVVILDEDDIYVHLPMPGTPEWENMTAPHTHIEKVEISVDIPLLQRSVAKNTDKLLSYHFGR